MMSVVEHEVRTAMQKGALLEGQCGLAGTRDFQQMGSLIGDRSC